MTTYEDIIANRGSLKQVKDCINAVMPTIDGIITTEEAYRKKIDKGIVPTGFSTKVLEVPDVGMALRDGATFAYVGNGVLVKEVSEDSKEGLVVKAGYLITEVAGAKCESLDDFNKKLDELNSKGDEFNLKVKIVKPKTLASYLKAEGLEMKEASDLDHDAIETWVQKTRSPVEVREKGLKKWNAQRDEKIGELELSLGAVNDSSLKDSVEELITGFRGDFDRTKLGNFNFEVKKVTTSIFRLETDLLKRAKEVKAEAKDKT
jgi:hypothetical protein